jgi:hypothetical protein
MQTKAHASGGRQSWFNRRDALCRMAALCSGLSTVFVCAGACLTSALKYVSHFFLLRLAAL